MTRLGDFAVSSDLMLDDRMRGFPTGHDPIAAASIGDLGLRPPDGRMALPLLSLDRASFEANTQTIMRHLLASGVGVAPHAKTPMSADLARWLVEAGAWGATVADARQASVLLRAGITRLILGNQPGGRGGAGRLAALMRHHPTAELHVFVDSPESLAALAEAWRSAGGLARRMPSLGLLIELGAGRGGLRDLAQAESLLDEILALPSDLGLRLTGVAAYEGAAVGPDPSTALDSVDRLLDRVGELHDRVRARVGPMAPLILTAGGSGWFDRVLARIGPVAAADGATRLILRSGAIFFFDHGINEAGLAEMARRGGRPEGSLEPALRLWAEVLSQPEPGLAICGLGLRDAAVDQGVPTPLRLWRDGSEVGPIMGLRVAKMNDQHAFLVYEDATEPPWVGDVVEFGLSHPCTNFDRHGLIWVLGPGERVEAALPTAFG